MNETYKMTDAEIVDLKGWCGINKDNDEYKWMSREAMKWIAEESLADKERAMTIIARQIARCTDESGMSARCERSFTVLKGWIYDLVDSYPSMLSGMHLQLGWHVVSLIDKYKPLRDYEKKLLRGLKGDYVTEILSILRNDPPPGEFCDEIHSAFRAWVRMSVLSAITWEEEKE